FILLLVAGLLAGGAVADRTERPSLSMPEAAARRALMPTAAPGDALASTWFCVGATAEAGSPADGVVVVANPTDQEAAGAVTVVPAEGEPGRTEITVAPRSTVQVRLREVKASPHAAALVQLDRGQVVAELVVGGPSESDATPCSSRASDRWYFADGVTAKDATLSLALFNPFPDDARVDLSFSTDQGRAEPSAFRPVLVPARSIVVKDIGQHVRRREAIATTVRVSAGRVVAAQVQTRTVGGKAGVSTALGAPSLGTEWHFAHGLVGDGTDEHYAVYNPGRNEASVLFRVILDDGVAEDFERVVPAQSRLDVVLNEEVGVPRGVGHSTTVESLNGGRVVVARALAYAPPAPVVGRADTLGARRAATEWVFPAGGTGGATDEYLVLSNPGDADATVSVRALGEASSELSGLQRVKVASGRRAQVPLREHVRRSPLPLVVTSDQPVVAERALYQVGPFAFWANVGIPLG
ncbi:MAG: DUF5719 family protein, partial [Acidimicrobiales bacterium]